MSKWLYVAVLLSCAPFHKSFAIMPDVRVLEILKTTRILDDGIGFDGTVAVADHEWTEFHEWFAVVPEPLDRINQLTEDAPVRAAAIYLSADAQSDDAFFRASLGVLHRFSVGTASELELDSVLAPGYVKRGLLASKFRETELRDVLGKCHARVNTNDRLAELIEHILSGKGASDIVESDEGSFPERYRAIARQSLRGDEKAKADKQRRPSSGESFGDIGKGKSNTPKTVLLVAGTLAVLACAFFWWCRFIRHRKREHVEY